MQIAVLRRRGAAVSRREADRNVIGTIDAVAERLGNTRSVCRKYYVHPVLIEAYRMGETVPEPAAITGVPLGTAKSIPLCIRV